MTVPFPKTYTVRQITTLLFFAALSFFGVSCNVFNQGRQTQIPGTVSPSLSFKDREDYERQRRALVEKDRIQSFSSDITLSPEEERVNGQLVALRQSMIRHYDSVHFFPPARNFYKSREHMYTTPLFRTLQAMPKGGIHHLHPSAGVSFRWLVRRALQEPHCYVFWRGDNNNFLKGQIHFFEKGKAPAGFFPIQYLNESVPNFTDSLYHLLTFNATIAGDSVDVWGEFEKRFNRMEGFTSYKPVYKEFLVTVFDSLISDGIQHVELRSHLSDALYDLAHPAGTYGTDSMVRYMQEAVAEVRKREPDFSLTLIYTNVRFQPLEAIREDFIRAFAARRRYPGLIKGYDLVAEEDAGHSTYYYRDVWIMRDSLSKVYGVDMPLYFHNGESNWQHVQNLYDAVLLGSPRIGHALNLSFFPAAEERVRNNKTCIEVAPLSNQILGYVPDLRTHPAHAWIRRGIQISISPDDPGLFGYVGVTPDFWSVFLAWELDLRDLKKLCINSIRYSSLEESEKRTALAAWQKKWDRFIREVGQ